MQPGVRFLPYKLFVGLFIPDVLASYNGLQLSSKIVWGKLAQYAGEDGNCFPAVDTIASGLGCSTRTVRRCIKELEEKQFIEVETCYNEKSRSQTSNRYYFLWHPLFDSALTRISGVKKSHRGDDKMSPLGRTRCQPSPTDKLTPEKNQFFFEKNPKRTRTTGGKSSSCPSAQILGWIERITPIKEDPDAWKADMLLRWQNGKLDLDLLEKQANKVAMGIKAGVNTSHQAVLAEFVAEQGDALANFLSTVRTNTVTIGGLSFDTDVARSMVAKTLKELG